MFQNFIFPPMKKLIIIASFLLCAQSTFAQLEKGMKNIGLSSGFNYNETKNNSDQGSTNNFPTTKEYTYKNGSYSISPTFNYFLSKKFSVGLSIGYTHNTTTSNFINYSSYTRLSNDYYSLQTAQYKHVSNGMNLSTSIKYYIPLSDQVFFFVRGDVGTLFSQGKTSENDSNSTYNITTNTSSTPTNTTNSDQKYPFGLDSWNIGISPGILFMPTKKIGLEFSLGNVFAYKGRYLADDFQFLNINSMSIGTAIYYFF
jgi:hypothetical protein